VYVTQRDKISSFFFCTLFLLSQTKGRQKQTVLTHPKQGKTKRVTSAGDITAKQQRQKAKKEKEVSCRTAPSSTIKDTVRVATLNI
jgi:hypothetical protein